MGTTTTLSPICGHCMKNMLCVENDVTVRLDGDRIVAADLYGCPTCGHQLLTGFAKQSIERHDPRTAEAWHHAESFVRGYDWRGQRRSKPAKAEHPLAAEQLRRQTT